MNGMNIQYGNMNPFREIQSGLATGMQMRGMATRRQGKEQPAAQPSNYIVPSPQRKTVNPGELLGKESQEMAIYNEYHKKTKDLAPEQRVTVYNKLISSGQVQTPIVQSIMLNEDIEKPDEAIEVFKKIKNNDPKAPADIETLILRLGGAKSPGGAAINSKMAEAQALQQQYDQEYALQLKMTLNTIDAIKDNPTQFGGKHGVMHPQTAQVVSNELNYAMELSRLDPKFAKDYLQKQKDKRVGGKPRQVEFVGYTREGRRIPFTGSSVEEFLKKHPDVLRETIMYPGREAEMERFGIRKTIKEARKRYDKEYGY